MVIKVNFRNLETKEYPKGITLYEIAQDFQRYYNYPILSAKVDNEICDLNRTIDKKCNIDFYDRSSYVGNGVYGCSVQFLMIVAINKLFGEQVDVKIQNSIDKGVFCQVFGIELTKQVVQQIESKMYELVHQNLNYTKLSVSRFDAIAYFKKKKQTDKVKVLKYACSDYVNLYRLDDVYDYFFNELAYSTKYIDSFRLTYISNDGFVLSYPNVYNPDTTLDYCHRALIADTFAEYTKWGNLIGINEVSDLNEIVSQGKHGDIIRLSEAHYDSQLVKIADKIHENKNNIKLVLIGGPSSSGKTSTSKKIAVYLQNKGYTTHSISIADYFLNLEDRTKEDVEEYERESINCIDVNLFNRHLNKLLAGEKVLLPEYNIITGKREYKKKWLQLKEKDIIIIEGFHAINEELTISIERKNKFKLYICPFTQINIDRHNRIHTSDTRKLRRIIRNNQKRGITAVDTLKMWKHIREDEEKYIFPYQDDVDMVINTSLMYELGVLRVYAEPLLFSVPENDEMYPEAIRLIKFLKNFLPIPSDEVPKDSLLCEFIGSCGFDKN